MSHAKPIDIGSTSCEMKARMVQQFIVPVVSVGRSVSFLLSIFWFSPMKQKRGASCEGGDELLFASCYDKGIAYNFKKSITFSALS